VTFRTLSLGSWMNKATSHFKITSSSVWANSFLLRLARSKAIIAITTTHRARGALGAERRDRFPLTLRT
jgi:hypothetical protein